MKTTNLLPFFIFLTLILVACKDQSLLTDSYDKTDAVNDPVLKDESVALVTEFCKEWDSYEKDPNLISITDINQAQATSMQTAIRAAIVGSTKKNAIAPKPTFNVDTKISILTGYMDPHYKDATIDSMYPYANKILLDSLKIMFQYFAQNFNNFKSDYEKNSKINPANYITSAKKYYNSKLTSFRSMRYMYTFSINSNIQLDSKIAADLKKKIGEQEYGILTGAATTLSVGFDSLITRTYKTASLNGVASGASKTLSLANRDKNGPQKSFWDIFNPVSWFEAFIDVVTDVCKGDPFGVCMKVVTFSSNTMKFGMAIKLSDKAFGSDNPYYNSQTSLLFSKSLVGSTIKSYYFSRKLTSGNYLSVLSSIYNNKSPNTLYEGFSRSNENIVKYVESNPSSDSVIKYARAKSDSAIEQYIHNGLKMGDGLTTGKGIVSLNGRYSFLIDGNICGIYNLFTRNWENIFSRTAYTVHLSNLGKDQYLEITPTERMYSVMRIMLPPANTDSGGLIDYLLLGDDGALHTYSYTRDAISVKVRGDKPIQYQALDGNWHNILVEEGTDFKVQSGNKPPAACYGYYKTVSTYKNIAGKECLAVRIPFDAIASSKSN